MTGPGRPHCTELGTVPLILHHKGKNHAGPQSLWCLLGAPCERSEWWLSQTENDNTAGSMLRLVRTPKEHGHL
jgi:hypothetical protein